MEGPAYGGSCTPPPMDTALVNEVIVIVQPDVRYLPFSTMVSSLEYYALLLRSTKGERKR